MSDIQRVAQQIQSMQIPTQRYQTCQTCGQEQHDGECQALRFESPGGSGWRCVRCGATACLDPIPRRRYCTGCDGVNATRDLTEAVLALVAKIP